VPKRHHLSAVTGENGLEALGGLLKAFVRQGGMFLHIDVIDSAVLQDAQKHPELIGAYFGLAGAIQYSG